ncbi:MAG TPA: ATP-binding protein [Stellaceae bacterium]|nr:ATP-binding protein [Stellaceae bacterium]
MNLPSETPQADIRGILIVDDDADFAESLGDLLQPQGYEVRLADNPEAALAALSWPHLGVAMLDVRLGTTSGVDLLAGLKAERPDLVCVMMTAHVDTRTAITALRQGAYDYCDKSGEPSELFLMLERCFERRQLEQERSAAMAALQLARDEAVAARVQAEAASRSKSEFLATMSHELRTPLNAIIGFSQVMMTETLGPVGTPQYRSYAKDIFDSGTHLLEIINDILDLSKAEAGKLDLDEDWTDLADVVQATFRLVGPRAERAGVALAMSAPPDLPSLWADERKLKQVLLNLISNAVKFTLDGGRVEIRISFDARSGYTVLVEDSGIGIAAADLQRVLEPFVQAENSLTRRHQGSGLGLPLAVKMTELHGGRLTIASDLGRGTRVRLTLPPHRAAIEMTGPAYSI